MYGPALTSQDFDGANLGVYEKLVLTHDSVLFERSSALAFEKPLFLANRTSERIHETNV